MKLSIVLLLLITILGTCRAGEPGEFPIDPPDPAAFARAINYYVSLGEKPAVRLLSKRIRHYGLEASYLCQALFEPKPGCEIGPPAWGSFCEIPALTMTSRRWPLLPLALSGKTYFVLDQHRLLTGVPEDPQDYISRCRANGLFRKDLVPVPTHAEAHHDARTLRSSSAWKAVKWKGQDRYGSYNMSEERVWENLKEQADAVK